MGCLNWQQKAAAKLRKLFAEPFHLLTITLLTVLLPLSFLLLARLSTYSFLLIITSESDHHSQPDQPSSSFLFSFPLHCNPALLYLIVSVFSISTLLHGLTGKFNLLNHESYSSAGGESRRHRLCVAWILLCTLQLCVGLGLEGSVEAGIDAHRFDIEKSLLSRIIFFLGLHETMLYWSRTVVKPVVDDTIFGFGKKEKWAERVCLAMIFGSLWWWRLRDEIESLVIVVEAKRKLMMGRDMADLIGWWLYYLTVTIGMLRIVKVTMWVMMILLCKRVIRNTDCSSDESDPCEIDNKV